MSRAALSRKPLAGFSLTIPVRFAECDSYGVVWHGNYALYIEQAREALTARFGFTAAKALSLGYRVPITRMEVRYHLPALPDSLLRVTARLRPPEVARLIMDYELRQEEGKLVATAETEQVVVNARGELLIVLPPDLKKMAAEIVQFQESLDTPR